MLNTPVRRKSKQREAILNQLRNLRSHPTADELYELVRLHLPNISMATVYRNLEVLCTDGLAQKLDLPGTQKRFDGDVTNHYHVRCITCGRMDDLDIAPITEIKDLIGNRSQYQVISYRLEFIGFCPDCVEANRKNEHG